VKKGIKAGKVINLSDFTRKRDLERNVYVVGANTRSLTDTLVPAYRQIMDMIQFIDNMVRTAIIFYVDTLYFECCGETGNCKILKNGKLIQEYPIERYIPLLNHLKVIFRLDKAEKRIPKRWETYKIKTEDGAFLCEAVPQTLRTATGEDVIINFYVHSRFRKVTSEVQLGMFPDVLNKDGHLWF
jgi:type II secretory ATPase GspE/PulE/Tfp pilus assembly ATPase PilB-like protein